MDANQLLFYLRGFFESVSEPTSAQIANIKLEVLRAQTVEAKIIPVEVVNPLHVLQSTTRHCAPSPVDPTAL